jgi:hypothetical protein
VIRRLVGQRPLAFALFSVLLALSFSFPLGAGTAQAAGFRYWSFWESGAGKWTYATQGPATAQPSDGAVVGFRFSVSEDSGDAARPRTTPDFDTICGSTHPKAGQERIAVVVDSGTPGDAPAGEKPPTPDRRTGCARVDEGASAADALASVAKPLRYSSAALLCAISGYPAAGCGEQVAGTPKGAASADATAPTATPAQAANDGGPGGGGPSVGLIAGAAAVLVLGAAGFWRARRRRG